jgi:hypothetical protein
MAFLPPLGFLTPILLKGTWKKFIFGNVTPEGFIFGEHQGITETTESRPQHHYFGRKSGTDFSDYVIARGDPPRLAEVIGGLFRILNNYQYADDDPRDKIRGETHQSNLFGYWGLAPLGSQDSGIPPEDLPPDVGHQLPPLTGVIIVAFYGGDTAVMGGYLSRARIRDVVRIDGSDSVLFGHNAEILVGEGDDMSDYKKLYNRWGYFCLKK